MKPRRWRERNIASRISSVADAEYFARRRLPTALSQVIESGEPGPTFGRNLEAYQDVSLRPRAGVTFPARDLRTNVLGDEIALPVIIAPTGNIRVLHRDAEPGVARAAGAAGTIVIVSTFTGSAIEDVVAAANGPVYYQLYFVGGRERVEQMLDRARRAGCRALVVTLDTTAPELSERPIAERAFLPQRVDLYNALRFLPQVWKRPEWLLEFVRDGMAIELAMASGDDGRPMSLAQADAAVYAHAPTWEDVRWVREQWDGPMLVKGLLSAEDARRAVDEGAAGVVVSNHGGHLLPSTPPTLEVLPEIVDAVGDTTTVLLDGGIRRGEDVVKAIALGARAVLIGRAYLWAHAAAGEPGVRRILETFRLGIDRTLALLGCPSIEALDASYIYDRDPRS